uniref:C2H2-type domain-containing protein n=1 Tax=Glossina palpalis gambiensis TaxID=67801 RepID=A0A1B0C6M5_9MUSC
MSTANPLPSGEGYQLTSSSAPTIPSTFQCQFCSRQFTTKTGAGVHARRAHPNELDQRNARTDKKPRWSEEEELLLARKEAELTIDGKTRFMNKALAALFPARSLEAIKKIRQKPLYRQHVERYVSSMSNERLLDAPGTSSDTAPLIPPSVTSSPSIAPPPSAVTTATSYISDDHIISAPPSASTYQKTRLYDCDSH